MAELLRKGGSMKIQLRPNLYLGDKDAFKVLAELKADGISSVIVVSNDLIPVAEDESGVRVHRLGLLDGPNYGWVKDLACHIPKYLMQNGEVVLIQSMTGMKRGAFVAARTICEMENKSIYDIFLEIKEKLPELDLSKVYF